MEQRHDLAFAAVGEIGGMKQRKRGGREQAALLAPASGGFYQRRRVPLGEVDAVTADFEPALQEVELGAFAGSVDAFDHDERAGIRALGCGGGFRFRFRNWRRFGDRRHGYESIYNQTSYLGTVTQTLEKCYNHAPLQGAESRENGPKLKVKRVARRRMATNFTKELRVKPGHKVKLKHYDADDTLGWDKGKKTDEALEWALTRLDELQYLLYAEGKRALLVVLQGLDAAGKDGTIRHVMSRVNPQGCRVASSSSRRRWK